MSTPSRTHVHEVPGTDTLTGALRVFVRFPTPRLLLTKIAVFAVIRGWLGQWSPVDLLILIGVAVYWPLQEWFFHQYLMHLKPFTVAGRTIDTPVGRKHRAHHRDPWIIETTLLPFRGIALLVPVNLAVWWLLTDTWHHWASGVLFFTAAALLYEWTHYLTHTRYAPRSAFYRRIWRNHRLHHFKNERYWHGFTVPWVDTLLGTDPDPASVPKSPTVRTLGVEGETG